MKTLTLIAPLVISLVAVTASASAKVTCRVDSPKISALHVNQDGGEETATLVRTDGTASRYLVLRSHGGLLIAVVDNALTGGDSREGIMLSYDMTSGRASLAAEGEILLANCAK